MSDNAPNTGSIEPPPEILRRLAQRLRALRRHRGWSQEQLAEHAGMHRTYVGAIERCERNPSLGTLDRLARGLQIGVAELLLASSPPRRS